MAIWDTIAGKGTGLGAGDRAPDFTLRDQHGEQVSLSDFRGERSVVVYFYPRDETPVCTVESCAFRDSYEVFRDADAEVLGISADSVESHLRFAEHHRLPFRLLTDVGGAVRTAFGVPNVLGVWPGRVTYVIDREGVIRHAFNSATDGPRHVQEALAVLRASS